jgi:hypothetical protein
MLGTIVVCLMAGVGLLAIGGMAWRAYKTYQDIRLLFIFDEG